MADRRVTVLNPAGYQEILQSADTLIIDSTSEFAGASFSQNVELQSAEVSANLVINGTPTLNRHAATVEFVNSTVDSARLTASAPIAINSQDISISYATNAASGSIRIATDAEASTGTLNNVAVTPQQLIYALDDITITAASPLNVTESPTNSWSFSIDEATNGASGIIRIATDVEASNGTATDLAVNPKQVKAAVDAIPYANANTNGLIQIATGAEITAGTVNNVAVTPAQLAQEVSTIDVTARTPLTFTQTGRVFDLDVIQATTTTVGVLRFANSSEAQAGTATDVAITPANMEARFDAFELVDGTTVTKGIVRFATNSDTAGGTETDAAVTPASLNYALNTTDYQIDCGTY